MKYAIRTTWNFFAVVLSAAAMSGCGGLGDLVLSREAQPLTRIFVPESVPIGKQFPVVVDADVGCLDFPELRLREDAANSILFVDLVAKRGSICLGAIVQKRFEGSVAVSRTGSYTVAFQGYDGPATKILRVAEAGEVSEIVVPPLSNGAGPNY